MQKTYKEPRVLLSNSFSLEGDGCKMLHWWCSLFVFITVEEEESFHVKSFLQTWSLTLKINSEQRLVGGHCKQTLLNKTRGNFTMESGIVKMGLILSLETDVNPIRGTSSRVTSNYSECFYLIVARCQVPNKHCTYAHGALMSRGSYVSWCHAHCPYNCHKKQHWTWVCHV